MKFMRIYYLLSSPSLNSVGTQLEKCMQFIYMYIFCQIHFVKHECLARVNSHTTLNNFEKKISLMRIKL